MALKISHSKTDLPEGAIKVSEKEALKYQKHFVQHWPLESEVFCLKFGSFIAGAVTGLSSWLIANHFRQFFKTDYKLYVVTVIPGLVTPFYFATNFTEKNVTNKILLMKVQCPVCINMKFALQQFFGSFLFPAVYTFSAYVMYADMKGTKALPSIQTDAKKFWKESFKAFKSGRKTFQVVGILQAVMIFFLPYWQHKELCNITNKSVSTSDSELLLS